jgi:hypothetical protein
VFAVGEPVSKLDPPTVIIGIPDTAWLKLKAGECVDFDLRTGGVFANLIIFRGKDGADIADILGKSQGALDGAPLVGVSEPTKQ